MASSAVAEIVAETMDNYLLMGHILRCKLIPKEEVHPELWVGANRKFRRVPTNRLERLHQNKVREDFIVGFLSIKHVFLFLGSV